MWLDSHAHLDDPDTAPAVLSAALRRLVDRGWQGALTAGYGPERFAASRELTAQWPQVRRAVGMHPEYLARRVDDGARQAAHAALEAELADPQVAAVGEIGLDKRYKAQWPLAEQLRYFRLGLRAARRRRLPVVLHIVGWYGHALTLLRAEGVPDGGAVHRWSGPLELVAAFEALGLGIALALEPRGSDEPRAHLARTVAADKLLLETDWPFLALGYDEAVADMAALGARVALWRGEPLGELAGRLNDNARRLYRLEASAAAP